MQLQFNWRMGFFEVIAGKTASAKHAHSFSQAANGVRSPLSPKQGE